MKINTLDQDIMQLLRVTIETELQRINKGLEGCQLSLGRRSTYTSTKATFKVEVTCDTNQIQRDLLVQFKLRQLHRAQENTNYKVIDYVSRNTKRPWILEDKRNGSQVKANVVWILNNMPILELPDIEDVVMTKVNENDNSFEDIYGGWE